jgi:hypothetical protein
MLNCKDTILILAARPIARSPMGKLDAGPAMGSPLPLLPPVPVEAEVADASMAASLASNCRRA